MGLIAKIIGLVLAAVGAVVFFFGINDTSGLSLVWFFIGLLTMSMGFSLLTAGRKRKEPEPPPATITEIRCDNAECDFKEIRDFKKGDYILKVVNETCPKCQSQMTIEGVYVIKEEKEDEKSKF